MSSELVSDAIDVDALDLDDAPTDPSFRTVRPHLVSDAPGVDLDAAERAAQQFLDALGVPTTSESLRGTPRRMAKAYAELFAPRPFELTTFPNDEGYDELVLARSIPLRSVCEHHLLPFVGVAHVGYLPGERILGLSQARPRGRALRLPPAGPGTAHHPGRRLAAGPARARRAWAS